MLHFTPDQKTLVMNQRRAHVAQHEHMQTMYGNSNVMLGNASPLPRDVFIRFDDQGIEVQRQVLSIFNDLAASVALPVPIGKLVNMFQVVSDSGEVTVSLDAVAEGKSDQQTYDYHGTPIPILSSAFGYGWRQVQAAETEGQQLDPAGSRNAMNKIATKLEDMTLVGDSSIRVGSDQLYGFTNHPQRNTRSTGNTLNGGTGAEWKSEFNATLRLLHADNFKVPATFYVNWDDWFYATSNDYSAEDQRSISARILEMEGVREVIPSDRVAANTLIAINKSRETVQLLNAMPMNTQAKFRANPTDPYDFLTWAAAALEIRYDDENNCGVAHSS